MQSEIILLKTNWKPKRFCKPGTLLSANDQLDKGPVMLRTATQTSSNELKGAQQICCKNFSVEYEPVLIRVYTLMNINQTICSIHTAFVHTS